MKLLNAVIGLSVGISTALLVSLSTNKVSSVAATTGVLAGGFYLGLQVKREKDTQPKVLTHLNDGEHKRLKIASLARAIAACDGTTGLDLMTADEIFRSQDVDVKHYLSVARSIVA